MPQEPKGFTLIELLIVVAIIAILAVVVILTLNPAQLLAQARDAQRISDMSTLKSAISFYLADVSSPGGNGSSWTSSKCYSSNSTSTPSTAGCGGRMAGTDTTTTSTTPTKTDGTGWIPINFGAISSGSPLGTEPVDPINNATYFYSFATNGSSNWQFEIDAAMESSKYGASGSSDVVTTDGGNSSSTYEVGTKLDL